MSKTIGESMLRAWQTYRYGADHEFDPNEPIRPSENFVEGFRAGYEIMRNAVVEWLYEELNHGDLDCM